MVKLQYFNGKKWVPCGEFASERNAWISLGCDNFNYRTVDAETGKVLTDKSDRGFKVVKWFRKLKRIINSYDENIKRVTSKADAAFETSTRAFQYAKNAESFIKERTDVSADIGVRGPSTIILTGIYKNREYVEIFDMPQKDFNHFVQHLKELKKYHQVKSIDAPYGMRAVIDTQLLHF